MVTIIPLIVFKGAQNDSVKLFVKRDGDFALSACSLVILARVQPVRKTGWREEPMDIKIATTTVAQ